MKATYALVFITIVLAQIVTFIGGALWLYYNSVQIWHVTWLQGPADWYAIYFLTPIWETLSLIFNTLSIIVVVLLIAAIVLVWRNGREKAESEGQNE